VVNQSLAPLAVTDPVLASRRGYEARFLHEVADGLATRVAVIPWQVEPPVGPEQLRNLVHAVPHLTLHHVWKVLP
jgi:arsenite-transporting ATPase